MKLFGHMAPNLTEVRADEVQISDRLAAGRYQAFGMSNVKRNGETVNYLEDDTIDGTPVIYIGGEGDPGFAWTLAPHETLMIETRT